MLRRVVLREALVLEHVQQRRLAGIVQAKEENLGVLVSQTWEVRRSRSVSGSCCTGAGALRRASPSSAEAHRGR